MTIIVDANIVFSTLVNPYSRFGDYLLTNPDDLVFVSPNFLKKEIKKHEEKILRVTRYRPDVLDELTDLIYSQIFFYSMEIIPEYIWHHATALMDNSDEKDIPYLAFALFFGGKLWTGDKSFCQKLSAKGLDMCFNSGKIIHTL